MSQEDDLRGLAKFMDFMLDPKLGQQDVLSAGDIPLAK